MKTRQPTRIYVLIMVVITAVGLSARMIQDRLPAWYVQYFGDYIVTRSAAQRRPLARWKGSYRTVRHRTGE